MTGIKYDQKTTTSGETVFRLIKILPLYSKKNPQKPRQMDINGDNVFIE